ncbi:phosphoribosylanthranilate isomerase [Anaeromicrobium sediminis]|uniref:N-(5'-phosphoribosyl)anthranilate isomerase n=1 Tax=Anaeromicrobium sediminis TaxID=1478221 RepID=A0A267MJ72_9FIRM|nr:phosphoribosylanthranilate isomerase [Anaeromicrobium sediminis]PAB59497.1 N-(5'-phosphoribosyl)anthranilate isomerase [Anaeromicrobium sediminis]
MTKVKICGLKNEEDIIYANKLKPDYVGFVFVNSTRQVNKYRSKELIDGLDESIKKVGVFLNTPSNEVNEIAKYCNLDILQFHGDESSDYCDSFHYEVWKSFRVKDINSLNEVDKYQVKGILLDTFTKGQYGGSGKTFDWNLATNMRKSQFVILAGGLTTENVKKAIERVKPMVVDVSSGVEVNGVKDFEKMKKFIENVRG